MCVCVLCECYLVAGNRVAFCGAAVPVSGGRLGVCVGNSCFWPKPTGPAWERPGRPWHTPSFSCLDKDLCFGDSSTEPRKKKRKKLSLSPWLGKLAWSFQSKLSPGSFYWVVDRDKNQPNNLRVSWEWASYGNHNSKFMSTALGGLFSQDVSHLFLSPGSYLSNPDLCSWPRL